MKNEVEEVVANFRRLWQFMDPVHKDMISDFIREALITAIKGAEDRERKYVAEEAMLVVSDIARMDYLNAGEPAEALWKAVRRIKQRFADRPDQAIDIVKASNK